MRIGSFDRWLLVVGLACAVLIAASAAPSGQGQAAPAVCDNKCREILVFIKNNGFEDCGVNDLYACNRCGANGLCASSPVRGRVPRSISRKDSLRARGVSWCVLWAVRGAKRRPRARPARTPVAGSTGCASNGRWG